MTDSIQASPYHFWNIRRPVETAVIAAEDKLRKEGVFSRLEKTREYNQLKVLAGLQAAGIAEAHFGGSSGYGYDDPGREHLDEAMAHILGAESALVRIQITTGTQAIALCLYGVLRPGDELLSLTGPVYDSLQSTIGHEGDPVQGSLREFGVSYREVPLAEDGGPAFELISRALRPETKMVLIQRSRGYTDRRALLKEDILEITRLVRLQQARLSSTPAEQAVIFVDNCYGEFTETEEPVSWGADLMAGSLIKNPGGGLAPSGGYVAGRRDLVDQAACRLTAPGLGREVGPSLGFNRLLTQGLFLAPHVVCESLKGMNLAAAVFSDHNFRTWPQAGDRRGDIIQTVEFGAAEPMEAFCRAVQKSSPVDSYVTPIPGPMPGYDHDVIMAAGSFVSGSSIELSADGPLRPPYTAYLQGGLVYEQVKLAVMLTLNELPAYQL